MKIIGIYCIVNKVNNKKYVGCSIDVKNRFRQHKHSLNRNKHCNSHLQSAWLKYKAENFEFLILEQFFNTDTLLERENHWITYFNCVINGYNQRLESHSNIGIKRTEKFKEACRQRMLGHTQSMEQIQKRINTIYEKKVAGFQRKTGWKLTPEQIAIRAKSQCKKVYQYDLNNNLIAEFEGVKYAAEKLGFNKSPISSVAAGHKKTYKGFKWSYTPLKK